MREALYFKQPLKVKVQRAYISITVNRWWHGALGISSILTQVVTFGWVAKSTFPVRIDSATVRRPDWSLDAPSTPLTTEWLLWPLQGWRRLGDALSRMKIVSANRQVLQTIAGTFPGNAQFAWLQRGHTGAGTRRHLNVPSSPRLFGSRQ